MFAVVLDKCVDVSVRAPNSAPEPGTSELRTQRARNNLTVAVKTNSGAGACRNIVNSESGLTHCPDPIATESPTKKAVNAPKGPS